MHDSSDRRYRWQRSGPGLRPRNQVCQQPAARSVPAVSKFRRNKKQIFAASLHRRPVYCKLHKGGLPSRFNSVFGPRFSVPVSHNPYLSRFVTDAVPTQAIFERPLAAQALRTSVDEELGSIARSVDMNGRHFTFAAGPCPVRQDVSHRQVRTPPSLIKIITILGESRQIGRSQNRSCATGYAAAPAEPALQPPGTASGSLKFSRIV